MNSNAVLILGGQGYVGSALVAHLQAAGLQIQSVDIGLRRIPTPANNQRRRYQELTPEELAEFGTIVLLAGHSSVPACDADPVGSHANNVSGFVDLVHKLRGQKLIYASSISVHVNTQGHAAEESEPLPVPISCYDLHKQWLERYAALAYPASFGLRFGTVCGPSPNLRNELLLNSMVLSAIRDRRIQVANRSAHRPLLGITDLCRAVETIITRPVPHGCYHLASVNTQIGAVADYIASRFSVPCEEIERPNNYDIQVNTCKFRKAAGFEFHDDVASLVESLHQYCRAAA